MSVSYFVRYEGKAADRDAFLSYYRQHHVNVLSRMPGIERILLHTPIPCHDPFPVHQDRFFLLVQMSFRSREDLQMALESSARAQARDDFAHFPPFAGLVFHQAAVSEEVFSR